MLLSAAFRRVLRHEVEAEGHEHVVAAPVLPEELRFPDGDDVLALPYLEEAELAQGQDAGPAVPPRKPEALVEAVAAVVGARRTAELEAKHSLLSESLMGVLINC